MYLYLIHFPDTFISPTPRSPMYLIWLRNGKFRCKYTSMCMNPYNSTLEIPILEYNSLSDLGQVQVHFGF